MDVQKTLLEFESELRQLGLDASPTESDTLFHPARRALNALLRAVLVDSSTRGHSLVDLVEACTKDRKASRTAAMITIRAMNRMGIFPPSDSANQLDRKAVALARTGAPELCEAYKVSNEMQSFESADRLRTIHNDICTRLNQLTSIPPTLDSISSSRQSVMKLLNGKATATYLQPFGHTTVVASIEAVFRDTKNLLDTADHTFLSKLKALRKLVEDQTAWAKANRTFYTDGYYVPFLQATIKALDDADKNSASRFRSDIRSVQNTDSFNLEKRYPLRDTSRLHKISIPLTNSGPGIATNVRATFTSTELAFSSSTVPLGDVPPGPFALAAEVVVGKPSASVTLEVFVEWQSIASTEDQSKTFSVRIQSQSSNVDWSELEKQVPYSTTPAEGTDFVGRKEKVRTLTSRLTKDKMESSYITGQKRVGKSSLALAVRDSILGNMSPACLLFEFGEIADVQPVNIMRNLGLRIAEFLGSHIPSYEVEKTSFSGSLAPLSRICDALLTASPTQKFVVIIDEFDEIPPELYKSGPLAETFFSNLRTLAAKKNLAFMLVGGENMPFIVGAQGDQLNKFTREGLSYFNRSDDWTDYVELVTAPVRGSLTWGDSAVNEVFTLTNGHPYYTKLLCDKAYTTALTERDTDITVTEVRRAYSDLVSALDTNAFAHLWKDGISKSRDDSEAISLQRCRVLVALGRVVRARNPLTKQSIIEAKHSSTLTEHQIVPVLNDFCRRLVLIEDNGSYSFVLPLFRDWLAQSGVNLLIADTLGDELSIGLQRSEDNAFVKEGEIASLCDTWPLYRGKRIGVSEVRQWLAQTKTFREQRLLFKILKNVRFFSELELREKLRVAYEMTATALPSFARRSLNDRRRDLLVTYVDGAAKSGHYYAARFAEENALFDTAVTEMSNFAEHLNEHEQSTGTTVNGIVIIDDIVGTGTTLSHNLRLFVDRHRPVLQIRNMVIVVIVMCATPEGAEYLRTSLMTIEGIRIEFRVCEPLAPRHFAFRPGNGIWDSSDEKAEARTVCQDIGMRIASAAPLGYQEQGLLVVFPDTCPNNSLPILHASSSRGERWTPLFERFVT